MLVGHAPSLEGCTRQLCGGKIKNLEEFAEITRKIPFLSIANCEKISKTDHWKLIPIPIPSMKHLDLEEFDWNNLNNQPKKTIQNFNFSLKNFNRFTNIPMMNLNQGYKRSLTYYCRGIL
jgi:hypothetical protein